MGFSRRDNRGFEFATMRPHHTLKSGSNIQPPHFFVEHQGFPARKLCSIHPIYTPNVCISHLLVYSTTNQDVHVNSPPPSPRIRSPPHTHSQASKLQATATTGRKEAATRPARPAPSPTRQSRRSWTATRLPCRRSRTGRRWCARSRGTVGYVSVGQNEDS